MRNQKAMYNITANLCLQLILMVTGFIVPKLIIGFYGSSMNGMVGSINQFLVCLNIVEAGLSSAIITSLYKPIANNDYYSINRVMSASRIFFNKSGMIFGILVLFLAFFYPILAHQKNYLFTFVMVITIGLSGVLEFFLIGKYRTLLSADQRGYVLTNTQSILIILNTLIKVLFIYLKYSMLVIQIGSTLVYLLTYFIISFYVKRKYKKLDLYAEPDTRAVEKRWDILVHQLVNIVLVSTPIILLTIFCGLKEVSMYTIYSMIFTAIIGVINIFQGGLIPYFGNVIHSDSRDILINIQRLYESGFYMIVACLFSCTFVLIIPFIDIYTKEFNDINYVRNDLAIAMIILGILRTIRIPNEVVLSAAGHFKETRSRAIIEASIHVIMSVLFVHFFGMIGVVLGGICSYGYRTIDIIIYTNKIILKTKVKHSFAIIGQNGILCMISILPFLTIINLNPSSYLAWFINGVGVFVWVAFVIVVGNLLLNYSIMKQLISRITEVLKIKFVWNRLKNNKVSS